MIGLSNKDWAAECAMTASLVAAARTASANGTAADTANLRRAVVVINAGVITDGTHTFKIQSSATSGGTYADDSAVLGSFTQLTSGAGGSAAYAVEIDIDNLANRFVRVVVTVSGATTGGVYSATIVGFNQRIAG